jgi:hypothetical protein
MAEKELVKDSIAPLVKAAGKEEIPAIRKDG